METFDIAVLPRTPRLYVERLDLIFMEPSLDFPGDKLRAIVATDMLWQAIGHHRQHYERTAFVGPIKDKIPGPDMIAMCGLYGQSGRDPLPRNPLGLGTDFEALFPPEALALLAAKRPAIPRQQRPDATL